MSGSKTEKPTPKKKREAAEKGQSFKSKDLIISCLILFGVQYLVSFTGAVDLMVLWRRVIENGFISDTEGYARAVLWSGVKIFLPFFLLCVAASALPALLQTGFKLASKALKINFSALNPVNGFKKLFSLRTLKDVVKTLLFLASFITAAIMFWDGNKLLVFSQVNSGVENIFPIWGQLFSSLVYLCLCCALLVLILDALAEYFLHIKDLKMDKQEVKREHKEQDGDPEIKSKRKELHMELLSEQVKSDIENSKVIVANPTHIAVGIYINMDVVGIPFISVLETNQRALAVRAYAEKVGVPVVENVRLARKIFKTHRRYSFVSIDDLDEVIEILIWLEQVENAWATEHQQPPEDK
ncbi:EscU/YscU/HrcU family type III secretion system export apparatus switch protein [Cedecea sp. FDAARGOS_727]|uniref:EscU/YscU/HrcU family type III secretion system export apparatus switch protein n=1 Tax=Cedecea sp. FDAARGOS_727 TaxID=2545798 RepID=UPI00143E6D27|nr:EscU/YscU/HrcU family type III secretion system export apparatus switch protein [Cedecea sp. FDAARGOS_727]QIX96595.1 EscU/YscU/HrcU family type III secretion system export apparatus switch protein [Cedecea sp. FDAARGOS_727]